MLVPVLSAIFFRSYRTILFTRADVGFDTIDSSGNSNLGSGLCLQSRLGVVGFREIILIRKHKTSLVQQSTKIVTDNRPF